MSSISFSMSSGASTPTGSSSTPPQPIDSGTVTSAQITNRRRKFSSSELFKRPSPYKFGIDSEADSVSGSLQNLNVPPDASQSFTLETR